MIPGITDIDLREMNIRVSPQTEKALIYLSRCFEANESTKELKISLFQATNRVRSLRDTPEPEIPLAVGLAEIDKKMSDYWSTSLRTSMRTFGKAATANALFLIGSPT